MELNRVSINPGKGVFLELPSLRCVRKYQWCAGHVWCYFYFFRNSLWWCASHGKLINWREISQKCDILPKPQSDTSSKLHYGDVRPFVVVWSKMGSTFLFIGVRWGPSFVCNNVLFVTCNHFMQLIENLQIIRHFSAFFYLISSEIGCLAPKK